MIEEETIKAMSNPSNMDNKVDEIGDKLVN